MTPEPLPASLPAGDPVPAAPSGRLRLVLVALSALAWIPPWLGDERGPDRTGALGALSLAAAAGLAATALLARTRRHLAIGEAATALLVSVLMAILVATRHPWLPGPDQRASWVPIFGPLAALSLLDLVVRATRPAAGLEITTIRAGAAIVAGASLLVALEGVPAGVALWIGLAPVVVHWPRTPRGASRGLEVLSAAAAALMLVASATAARESAEVPTLWPYVFRALGLALLAVAVRGLFSRAPESAAPRAQAAPPGP